jgi:membrane protease YdiL (CAAX protease family)
MSRRLDRPIAVLVWLGGFAWVAWRGSWVPLAVAALVAAMRLLAFDQGTRRLLAPRAASLALAAAGALAMIGGTYGLYALATAAAPDLAPATAGLYRLLGAGGYGRVELAALVVGVSACEEVVWRGRALEEAERLSGGRLLSWPAAARVLGAALLYGACHLSSGSLLLGILAAACGFAWGLLRVAGRSLWPAVLVHAAWDLAVLVAWPLAGASG